MQILACDGQWQTSSGTPVCSGTLAAVDANQIPNNGITTEQAGELIDASIYLFAIVFGFLALRKAL